MMPRLPTAHRKPGRELRPRRRRPVRERPQWTEPRWYSEWKAGEFAGSECVLTADVPLVRGVRTSWLPRLTRQFSATGSEVLVQPAVSSRVFACEDRGSRGDKRYACQVVEGGHGGSCCRCGGVVVGVCRSGHDCCDGDGECHSEEPSP